MTIKSNRSAALSPSSATGPMLQSKSIGAILIDTGRLSPEHTESILRLQNERSMRFGDAALALGILTPADIDFALSQQFDYPYLLRGESDVNEELIAAYNPFDSKVESLRGLRSQLMLRWFDTLPDRNSITITSPGSQEGRSFLAANLAVVFSQLGERTLLIDADMRNPRQHVFFGLENSNGLSSLLSGRGGKNAVVRVASLRGLSVLPSGPLPPNPQELLGRSAFSQMLADLTPEFDVVLVDTPAGQLYADARIVAVRTGAALVVARKHATYVAGVKGLVEDLAQSRVAVVGTVLNEI